VVARAVMAALALLHVMDDLTTGGVTIIAIQPLQHPLPQPSTGPQQFCLLLYA
jgi:hypothetical protein